MALTGMDLIVLAAFQATTVAMMLYTLKSFGSRLAAHDARILALEEKKVGKKDWVRVVMGQQHRQEETRNLVASMSGKLDASLGIGAQVGRAADAMEALTRKVGG